MDRQGKFWRREPRNGSLGQDELENIAVDDPDPTSDAGTANRSGACRFEWLDVSSPTLILSWSCTRELGHHGKHLAGTGQGVAAVHPRSCLRRRLPASRRDPRNRHVGSGLGLIWISLIRWT